LVKEGDGTKDKEILERHWLLVDADAIRPRNISATPLEKHSAELLINDVAWWLHRRGLTDQIIGDSGNGFHCMVRWPKPLPADDSGKTQRLLKHLAIVFNDWGDSQIDVSVFNPARIWKLPGTLVCKGDHSPEIGREWRMCKIIVATKRAEQEAQVEEQEA
jgi:hypothetical protein